MDGAGTGLCKGNMHICTTNQFASSLKTAAWVYTQGMSHALHAVCSDTGLQRPSAAALTQTCNDIIGLHRQVVADTHDGQQPAVIGGPCHASTAARCNIISQAQGILHSTRASTQ
jgi:hypothetical protein